MLGKFVTGVSRRPLRSLVLTIAVVEPIVTLPQIGQIWLKRQTTGVSTLTWGLYDVSALVWLVYGLKIHDRPIIVSSLLWLIMDSAVVVGAMVR